MLSVELLTLLLAITQCLVEARPVRDEDIHDLLQPLESDVSKLLSFPTPLSEPGTPEVLTVATYALSATNSRQSSAFSVASGQQSTIPSNLAPSVTSETVQTVGAESSTISDAASQSLTGGTSPNTSSNRSPSGTAAASLGGASATATGSSSGTAAVIPTTTLIINISATSATETSSSSPTSGLGPNSGGNSGSQPGSGSGSGSGSTSADSTSSKGLSPAEIAAAAILPLLALLALLFLLFRYNKSIREKCSTWRQERLEQSAYRRALDDPILSFGMRQHNNHGLGMGDVEALIRPQKSRPLSFGFSNPNRPFPQQPRKPVHWDGSRIGHDSAGAIEMAMPMPVSQHSRSNSDVSEDTDIYGGDDQPSLGYQDARSNQIPPEGTHL